MRIVIPILGLVLALGAPAAAQGVVVEPDPATCVVGVDRGCMLAIANAAAAAERQRLDALPAPFIERLLLNSWASGVTGFAAFAAAPVPIALMAGAAAVAAAVAMTDGAPDGD